MHVYIDAHQSSGERECDNGRVSDGDDANGVCANRDESGAVLWVAITSGSPGTGSGTVTFSVANGTGGSRKGRITVNGKRVVVAQD